jgi:hypothetical protein
MGELAIQQVMRLLSVPALGHIEAEPRHDRGRAFFVALDYPSLETEPAKLAAVFPLDTKLMRELSLASLRLTDFDLEQGGIFLMGERAEAAGRDFSDRRIEAEQFGEPLIDVEEVLREVPFPNACAASASSAAKPVRIGQRGEGSGFRAGGIVKCGIWELEWR